MKLYLAAATALALSIQGGHAQEIVGQSLTLSFSGLSDDFGRNKTAIEGSLEVGFGNRFSTQIDLAYRAYDQSISDDLTSLTLHGLTPVSENLTLGAFIGRDDGGSADRDYVGIEALGRFGAVELEGYIADYTDNFIGVAFGIDAKYDFGNNLAVGVSYDDIEFLSASSLALTGYYDLEIGAEVFASVGSRRLNPGSGNVSDSFIGIGIEFDFGNDTTFGTRGITKALPGI